MAEPDIMAAKPSAKPRSDAPPAGAGEPRAFDATNIASDGPAEQLNADIPRHGPNGVSLDTTALKAAASDFRGVVTDVLKGKAGSARTLAADTYEQLRGKSSRSLTKADTLVRQRPYAALGAAVVFGMLFASLTRRRG